MRRLLRLGAYAFFISFTGSLPVGTLNVNVTNLVIEGNVPAASLFGLGAILVEVGMICAGLIIVRRLEGMGRLHGWLRIIGCIVVLILPYYSLESAWYRRSPAAVIPFAGHAPLVSGL